MRLRIPKRYFLYGQPITVQKASGLVQGTDAVGIYSSRTCDAQLQEDSAGWRITREQIERTFCHEMVHSILFMASYDELARDEDFVRRISNLLHQALTTAEYK